MGVGAELTLSSDKDTRAAIAIVVLTYNRVGLLRQCVENVLLRTSRATREIVIWNNASSDDTRRYLDGLHDPRFRIIHHPENIGQNAYSRAFPMTTAPYLIEIDDDVVDAPEGWDQTLLESFLKLPSIGFLQAQLADDGFSPGADLFYRSKAGLYRRKKVNGVNLWVDGPVGGGCTITSRELHDRVGGFKESKKHVFWHEDAKYIEEIEELGYGKAILADVVVVHHGGIHYSEFTPEKQAYYSDRNRREARKRALKNALLRLPFMASLNERFGWFEPPQSELH
jgi:GT2 family glycosyltransferase